MGEPWLWEVAKPVMERHFQGTLSSKAEGLSGDEFRPAGHAVDLAGKSMLRSPVSSISKNRSRCRGRRSGHLASPASLILQEFCRRAEFSRGAP